MKTLLVFCVEITVIALSMLVGVAIGMYGYGSLICHW